MSDQIKHHEPTIEELKMQLEESRHEAQKYRDLYINLRDEYLRRVAQMKGIRP